MFNSLHALPDDPILGLMARYKNDTHPQKVDLGVGIYKDKMGNTPILSAVKEAEQQILSEQTSKAYIQPQGDPLFVEGILSLLLDSSTRLRSTCIQTPGGCGALRLGAELIKVSNPHAGIWVSDPTWGNHIPLFGAAGLNIKTYPYYDYQNNTLAFEAMLATLDIIPEGEVVVLHGCCHNPTGADLSLEQWNTLTETFLRKNLIPFIDVAYQGFAIGIDEDLFGPLGMLQSLPEGLLAVSCSKNFGLYRERVGALVCTGEDQNIAQTVLSRVLNLARGSYSMPPNHGAAIVGEILASPTLKGHWAKELGSMRDYIIHLRKAFSQNMREILNDTRFDFVEKQSGMFSFLGLSKAQIDYLIKNQSIYLLDNSRASISGLNQNNLTNVCISIAQAIKLKS